MIRISREQNPVFWEAAEVFESRKNHPVYGGDKGAAFRDSMVKALEGLK